jgi:cytochrome c-type biogenesis protein CcmF
VSRADDPGLGHFALIGALCIAVVQAVPLVGSFRGNDLWMALARPAAQGQFVSARISTLPKPGQRW